MSDQFDAIRDLTDLQLDLLEVLWEREEGTVTEVQEALLEERGLAATTVATLLSRLERRGVLTHRTDGRVFVYRPLVTRADVRALQVSALADRLFEGDMTALVSHLITTSQISPGDMALVKRLLAEHTPAGEKSNDR
jgi:BlaI family penicillinase repressor